MGAEEIAVANLVRHREVVELVAENLPLAIADAGRRMAACLRQGGTIYWCGNGGSASDSQHLAAELVGRYRDERRALRSVALSTDTSILTSVGNDFV